MKPVMISVPWKSAGDRALHALARLRPLHGGPERTPFDDDDVARVDPARLAGQAGLAGIEELTEQPRRPDLAEAGDQVADVAGGRAGQPHGVEDALDVMPIAIEGRQVQPCRTRIQQFLRDGGMPGPQRIEGRRGSRDPVFQPG
jgi:hypothetical protein